MTGVPLTDRARALLDAPVFAVVATVGPDGTPHQSVVWVTRDGSHPLFGIERGSRKERELRRSGRAGVLLLPPGTPYSYVSLWGAAELEPHERHAGLMDEISRKYTGLSHAEFLGGSAPADEDLVFVRLVPERVLDIG